jgi:hypothetical protein
MLPLRRAGQSSIRDSMGGNMVQPAVKVLNIAITPQGLEPRTVAAPVNEPIRFVVENRTGSFYQFAIPAADYRIDNILPGQTREATFTFVDVGTLEIDCRPPNAAQPTFHGQLTLQALY